MPRRRAKPTLPELVWRDGLHLAGTPLWFDAPRRHHLSFVSDARVRLGRALGRVLATPATAALLGLGDRSTPLLADYGRPLALGRLRIELAPSGIMLGAAQAAVDTPVGRVVYGGEIAPAGTATAPPAGFLRCDLLVLAAPPAPAPPAPAPPAPAPPAPAPPAPAPAPMPLPVAVEAALAEGRQPVVLAQSPGPAQDALAALARFPLCAHRDVVADARVYAGLGVRLPAVRSFRGPLRAGEVLVWPSGARTGGLTATLARPAFLPSPPAAAELPALLDFVATLAPRRLLLVGARAADAVVAFRAAGVDAEALASPAQMGLF